jgi:hypothetical protein
MRGRIAAGGEVRVTEADRFPTTRYARSGDVGIAYQVVGRGPIDVLIVPGEWSLFSSTSDAEQRSAPAVTARE